MSAESAQVISEFYTAASSDIDAAALFWYVRNKIFFDNNLQCDDRVMLCKYEDLVSRPEAVVSKLYGFMGGDEFDSRVVAGVHAKSVSKGSGVSLSSEVNTLCNELMQRMDDLYESPDAR